MYNISKPTLAKHGRVMLTNIRKFLAKKITGKKLVDLMYDISDIGTLLRSNKRKDIEEAIEGKYKETIENQGVNFSEFIKNIQEGLDTYYSSIEECIRIKEPSLSRIPLSETTKYRREALKPILTFLDLEIGKDTENVVLKRALLEMTGEKQEGHEYTPIDILYNRGKADKVREIIWNRINDDTLPQYIKLSDEEKAELKVLLDNYVEKVQDIQERYAKPAYSGLLER